MGALAGRVVPVGRTTAHPAAAVGIVDSASVPKTTPGRQRVAVASTAVGAAIVSGAFSIRRRVDGDSVNGDLRLVVGSMPPPPDVAAEAGPSKLVGGPRCLLPSSPGCFAVFFSAGAADSVPELFTAATTTGSVGPAAAVATVAVVVVSELDFNNTGSGCDGGFGDEPAGRGCGSSTGCLAPRAEEEICCFTRSAHDGAAGAEGIIGSDTGAVSGGPGALMPFPGCCCGCCPINGFLSLYTVVEGGGGGGGGGR